MSLWQWVSVRFPGRSTSAAVLSTFGTWIMPRSGFPASSAPATWAGNVPINRALLSSHCPAGSPLFAGPSTSTLTWHPRPFISQVQRLLHPQRYHPALLSFGLTNCSRLQPLSSLSPVSLPIHKLFSHSDSSSPALSILWGPVPLSLPCQIPGLTSALVPRHTVQACFNTECPGLPPSPALPWGSLGPGLSLLHFYNLSISSVVSTLRAAPGVFNR